MQAYKQLFTNESILTMLKDNFDKNHGKEGSTIYSTTVPYITIAHFGIYEIKARIAQFYNRESELEVVAFCGGCFNAEGETLTEKIEDIKRQIKERHAKNF